MLFLCVGFWVGVLALFTFEKMIERDVRRWNQTKDERVAELEIENKQLRFDLAVQIRCIKTRCPECEGGCIGKFARGAVSPTEMYCCGCGWKTEDEEVIDNMFQILETGIEIIPPPTPAPPAAPEPRVSTWPEHNNGLTDNIKLTILNSLDQCRYGYDDLDKEIDEAYDWIESLKGESQ